MSSLVDSTDGMVNAKYPGHFRLLDLSFTSAIRWHGKMKTILKDSIIND